MTKVESAFNAYIDALAQAAGVVIRDEPIEDFIAGVEADMAAHGCECGCGLVGFEIGEVVSLIVGGPDMVVISACEFDTVEVAWADSDGDVNIDVFPVEALVPA